MSNVPIWADPPPGARKPRFTREQIAATALAIADRDGFSALCMRRIAEDLGAGTMTLYYYIRTKDDLLTLIADALMAEVNELAAPLPTSWRAAIEQLARATHATFLQHPWALSSLEGAQIGPSWLRHIEQSLTAIEPLALPAHVKLELLSIVDDFVFGTVLRSVDMEPVDAKTGKAINDITAAHLRTGDYPRLAAVIGRREPFEAFVEFSAHMTSGARFEHGLAMLLDGFALGHGLATGPPSAIARTTAPRKHRAAARPSPRLAARPRRAPRPR